MSHLDLVSRLLIGRDGDCKFRMLPSYVTRQALRARTDRATFGHSACSLTTVLSELRRPDEKPVVLIDRFIDVRFIDVSFGSNRTRPQGNITECHPPYRVLII